MIEKKKNTVLLHGLVSQLSPCHTPLTPFRWVIYSYSHLSVIRLKANGAESS